MIIGAVLEKVITNRVDNLPADMAERFVLSRFYLHDYLERTIYRELGLNLEE